MDTCDDTYIISNRGRFRRDIIPQLPLLGKEGGENRAHRKNRGVGNETKQEGVETQGQRYLLVRTFRQNASRRNEVHRPLLR